MAAAFGCSRPEGLRLYSPGPFKDIRKHKHRHVAAHAVALPGNLQQLPDHRFLRGRVAIVELKGIRPARKVRVAPMGQKQIAALALDPRIVLRGARARSNSVPPTK